MNAIGLSAWLRALTLAAVCAAVAGAGEAWPQARVITVTGVARCYNYTHSLGLWSVLPKKGRPGRLVVRDGDILALAASNKNDDKENLIVMLAYQEADGTDLALQFDGQGLVLAGKTVALALSDQAAGWEWLKKASDAQLNALRCLMIEGKLDAPRTALLKQVASRNPKIDIALGEEAPLGLLLSLFTPRRVLAPGHKASEEEWKLLVKQRQIETLWIAVESSSELASLSFMPQLRRLVLGGWEPAQADLFPWGCRGLRSLTLMDCELKTLAAVEHLTELRELRLMNCDELGDLRALERLSRLEVLSLWLDDSPADCMPAARLPRLRQLNLSAEFDQDAFDSLVKALPHLESLDLLGCKNVKKLAVLKELRGLKHLTLLTESDDLKPVLEMKHLRLLTLPDKLLKEAKVAAAVAEALPETAVTEGHLCLGSGWLLLLLPAVATGLVLWRRRLSKLGGRHA